MFSGAGQGNEVSVHSTPEPQVSNPQPVIADATQPANRPTGLALPPRLPSPADPVEVVRRPESDPDLWVAVAAELAE